MRHAIDLQVHESCMHVAVRVLHSCAFIAPEARAHLLSNIGKGRLVYKFTKLFRDIYLLSWISVENPFSLREFMFCQSPLPCRLKQLLQALYFSCHFAS